MLWWVSSVSAPWQAGAVLTLAALGVLFIRRDPDRETPPSGVVAPADGRVAVIREEDDGRLLLGIYLRGRDVHVNRAPTDEVGTRCSSEPTGAPGSIAPSAGGAADAPGRGRA